MKSIRFRRLACHAILPATLLFAAAPPIAAQAPVEYRLSFPDAAHHVMHVDVTFPDVPDGPLEIVMSRTSPGRYAVHEFARHVYGVSIDDAAGAALVFDRPEPWSWRVNSHAGRVRVRYKVFGDRLDGTFLSVDAGHAHLNVPASLMWARGFERRPARVTIDAPASWRVSSQLHPTSDPRSFTAGSLHYLMDSPMEISAHAVASFTAGREFRVAVHHQGSREDVDRFVSDIERIVLEQRAIFGEFPAFEEPYTFIADYLPHAAEDAMEHRNSTVMTGPYRLRVPHERLSALAAAAHEFFHAWNVERLRPRSLEPFRFDAPNPSADLWFAEGFTSYYGPLTMRRAGLWGDAEFLAQMTRVLERVRASPARQYRSVEDASRMAQYVDQAAWIDPTSFDNHYISYYDWGAAIGLALDLALRARTDNRVTLDDYMRRLWADFGREAGEIEGVVPRPYASAELRRVLGDVAGDAAFADEFFSRFVHGREAPSPAAELERAGFALVRRNPSQSWIGAVALEFSGGRARVSAPTIEGTPAFAAGLTSGDELLSVDGRAIDSPLRFDEAVIGRAVGERLRATIRRLGVVQQIEITTAEDPGMIIVPIERTGRMPTPDQRRFRDAWLGSRR